MTKPIRNNNKAVSPVIAVILMVAITVVLAGVLYVWVWSLWDHDNENVETIIATLDQGDGNMTSGCLFTLSKGSGSSVEIRDYTILVGKAGQSPIALRWPEDGNSTYTIDIGLYGDDGLWWDAAETMGFDAPAGLKAQDITDGDTIEVIIKNEKTETIVYTGSFNYRD
ncbi:MAG: type IV pilin [Thermoplasmata archaeon]|nr:type IV pilin [Thermoplasmata archaeon]